VDELLGRYQGDPDIVEAGSALRMNLMARLHGAERCKSTGYDQRADPSLKS
jgi:hypothetical protein